MHKFIILFSLFVMSVQCGAVATELKKLSPGEVYTQTGEKFESDAVVSWYDSQSGFGFVETINTKNPNANVHRVFVSYTVIEPQNNDKNIKRTLKKDQIVHIFYHSGKKGYEADAVYIRE